MREIKNIHEAISAPIADLITYKALPTRTLEHLDPFLFLNHHGPQVYAPNNNGLPFGPHPHRGFETLTFIIKGDVVHWDSSGSKSVIKKGGIQWMTAGSGLIHSEVSSEEFKKHGGEVELLQLWMNLPAKYKMTPPRYTGVSEKDIPQIKEDNGKATINLISGKYKEHRGPVESITGLTMATIDLKDGGEVLLEVPESDEILLYVVNGEVTVNERPVSKHQLVEFKHKGEKVKIKANGESLLIFGLGQPFNEPIVAHGPFVMNSEREIREAFEDYQAGKMGRWEG